MISAIYSHAFNQKLGVDWSGVVAQQLIEIIERVTRKPEPGRTRVIYRYL